MRHREAGALRQRQCVGSRVDAEGQQESGEVSVTRYRTPTTGADAPRLIRGSRRGSESVPGRAGGWSVHRWLHVRGGTVANRPAPVALPARPLPPAYQIGCMGAVTPAGAHPPAATAAARLPSGIVAAAPFCQAVAAGRTRPTPGDTPPPPRNPPRRQSPTAAAAAAHTGKHSDGGGSGPRRSPTPPGVPVAVPAPALRGPPPPTALHRPRRRAGGKRPRWGRAAICRLSR